MKRIFSLLLCFLLLFLGACTSPSPTSSSAQTPESTIISSTEPATLPESSVVSTEASLPPPNIQEQLLLPTSLFTRDRIASPEFVMLHFTSAVVNHRNDPYSMEKIREIFISAEVSVHYIIDRDGTIWRWVAEDRVAYHAGKGSFRQEAKYENKMNDYAIGIELAAIGSERDMAQYLTSQEYRALDPSLVGYTEKQYESLSALVRYLCQSHQIPYDREHVIGHQEYSSQKSDPGELFDWNRLFPAS
jgi:N-acetyl-anhydromuramyl-L-alanine amidase AmpD